MEKTSDIAASYLKPAERIARLKKETGRKVVVVTPGYFPPEIVHAAGAIPYRIWGISGEIGKSDAYMQGFACSLSRSVLHRFLSGEFDGADAFLVPNKCDSMQAVGQYLQNLSKIPVIHFPIPMTSSDKASDFLLERSVKKVVGELEGVLGGSVTAQAIAASAASYGRMNAKLKELLDLAGEGKLKAGNFEVYEAVKASYVAEPDGFAKTLGDFISAGKGDSGSMKRVYVTGMVPEPMEILKIFDRLKLRICKDDFGGSRRLLMRPEVGKLDAASIAAYYRQGPACSTLPTRGVERTDEIAKAAAGARAAGVVWWQVKFCENESFDRVQALEAMKERGIPAIYFESEFNMGNFEPISNRLQAFAEMLG